MNFLSFEKFLGEDRLSADFGATGYKRNSKERQHASREVTLGNAYALGLGQAQWFKYNGASNQYVVCTGVTYDAVLSIYDVNGSGMAVYRFFDFDRAISSAIERSLHGIKYPNFEARILGMQNGHPTPKLDALLAMLERNRASVFEADLFGTDVRNIAFDLCTGVDYDILMENRPYKPGELKNTLDFDSFRSHASQKTQKSWPEEVQNR